MDMGQTGRPPKRDIHEGEPPQGGVEGSVVLTLALIGVFETADTVPGVYEVSTKVTSNVPVVAKRAMNGDGKQRRLSSAKITRYEAKDVLFHLW